MMFLAKVFNVILYRQYLSQEWKQSHMNFLLKLHTPSYQPICLLDTIGSFVDKTYSRESQVNEVSMGHRFMSSLSSDADIAWHFDTIEN